jgi:hypothetical protein
MENIYQNHLDSIQKSSLSSDTSITWPNIHPPTPETKSLESLLFADGVISSDMESDSFFTSIPYNHSHSDYQYTFNFPNQNHPVAYHQNHQNHHAPYHDNTYPSYNDSWYSFSHLTRQVRFLNFNLQVY